MNKRYLLLGALGALPLLSSGQSTIFNDSWADGSLAATEATDIGWYTSSSTSAIEVAVGSMGLVTGGSGRGIHGIFTPQTLNVGDVLTLTYTFTTPATIGTTTSTNGFRAGLFNSLGKPELLANLSYSSGTPNHIYDDLPGYMLSMDVIGDTAASNLDIREHDLTAGLGRFMSTTSEFIALGSGGSAYAFLPNTSYTGVMNLTRSGADEITIFTSMSQGATLMTSHSVVDTSGISLTYDMVGFHVNSNQFGSSSAVNTPDNGIDFTNVMVEYTMVPEPSTYALLLGALGLGLCVLRRRK